MQNKTLIIFLHGWGGNKNSWDKNISYFEKLGFPVLAVEMPGFDLPNPLPSWGIPEYAEFVKAEIAKNFPNQKIILVGHSFGGRISVLLASKNPELVHALVLTDSAGLNLEPPFMRKGLIFISKLAKWLEKKIFLSKIIPKLRKIMRSVIGTNGYKNADDAMKEVFKNVVNLDLSDKLQLIECPTLVIWGENDDVTPIKMAKAFEAGIKNSKLEIIKGAGHKLHQTHSDKWNQTVIEFISKN